MNPGFVFARQDLYHLAIAPDLLSLVYFADSVSSFCLGQFQNVILLYPLPVYLGLHTCANMSDLIFEIRSCWLFLPRLLLNYDHSILSSHINGITGLNHHLALFSMLIVHFPSLELKLWCCNTSVYNSIRHSLHICK
jgi:hypothetical protein